MRKINEIFYSIQGEGCRAGIPSVFIRFSGCNMKCGFCDTRHEEGKLMSDEEIFEEVKKFNGAQVVLTGGEPSLFIDESFLRNLKNATSLPVTIETNGTIELPDNIDWVTISPKFGINDSAEGEIKALHADELKVIDLGQDLEPYFNLKCVGQDTIMLLQPCFVENKEECEKNTRRTIRRVLEDPRWRLSLQTHRYLGIR